MPAVALDNNYYKEYQGVDYLSRTFQSSLNFSPSDVTRRTISQENFTRQRAKENRSPKTPWGRKYSYGGIGAVSLPDEHRPKGEPPVRVQKGHRHVSSGVCIHPRYVTSGDKYSVTSLRKSNLRANDELIGPPTKVDVSKHSIGLKFPAEHPFASHMERASLFPPYDIPTNQSPVCASDIPIAAPDTQLLSKSRGSAYRHETVPLDRDRNQTEWHEGPNFFQLPKGGDKERQSYYPVPLKSLDPNMKFPRNICTETARALKQIRKSHWTSTYHREVNRDQVFQSKYMQRLDSRGKPATADEFNVNKDDIQEKQDITLKDKHTFHTLPNAPTSNVPNRFDVADKTQTRYSSKNSFSGESNEPLSQRTELNLSSSVNVAESSPGIVSNVLMSATYPPNKSRQIQDGDTQRNVYSEELNRGWSRSDFRRKFHRTHQDKTPDLRRKPDLRITTNERRHRFPDVGDVGSYVWNGLSVPYLEETVNE